MSGVEKMRKPHPEFFQILFDRYKVDPATSIFIDDNLKNIEAGNELGLTTIHFTSPERLGEELQELGVLETELK